MNPDWTIARERGSVLGMRLVLLVLRLFGDRAASAFLFPIAFYFYLTGRSARRASLDYLARLHRFDARAHRHPTFMDGFRHMLSFARNALDRVRLWQDDEQRFHFEKEGGELVAACHEKGQGAIFIGAHAGSFEALRALSAGVGVRVNAVMYLENARMFNAIMRAANPRFDLHIINLKDRSVDAVLELKERIDRGEIVALLADRFYPSSRHRAVRCPFLGSEAAFPANPWIMAHLLECPVFLVAGLREANRSYRCIARPLADRLLLPRTSRESALRDCVGAYARFLESICRSHPLQWFNFYDFWSLENDNIH